MTVDEARKFAEDCIDAWPSGPKAHIWRRLVIGWEHGPARQALSRLIHEAEKGPPTPGALSQRYSNLKQPHTDARGIQWTGNEISLDEYLTRLATRAAGGNQEAADELDNWNRWLTPKETA